MRDKGAVVPPHVARIHPAIAGLTIAAIVAGAIGVYLFMRSGKALSGQGLETATAIDRSMRDQREVDPQLIEYSEVGRTDTGLDEPRGLALGSDGTIYVAGDTAIRQFDERGAIKLHVDLAAAPHCLAIDDSGVMYVGLRDHVEVYDTGGHPQARWASPGRDAYLTSVAVSGDSVWVADAGRRVVLRYDRSGRVLSNLGKRDESRGIPGLVVPSPHLDVAPASGGLVLVSNPGRRRVEAYTVQGELKTSWGSASQAVDGFSGCCNPTDIAVFPDGRVVTSEKGLPRVKIYSAEGVLECVVAAPADLPARADGFDLAIDSRGRVLVLDARARAVRAFARKQ